MQDPDTRPLIDESLARDEEGGRRLQWRRTRPDRGVNCARPCRRQRLLLFRVTNLFPPSLLRMQSSTEPPGPEGGNAGRRPRLAAMTYRKTTMGATVIRTSGSEGAILWKCEHVRLDLLCRFSPPGVTNAKGGVVVPHRARCLRRRGSGRTPRRRQVELPRLARPKGCFDTSDEWS